MPPVNRSEAESFTVTCALVPLNVNALPYLPEVVHVALAIVPLFPLPDTSFTTVPLPSLKEYAATRPVAGVGVGVVVGAGVEVGVGVGVGEGVGVGAIVAVAVAVGVAVAVAVGLAVAVAVAVGVGEGLSLIHIS